jgi:hypothetical protein
VTSTTVHTVHTQAELDSVLADEAVTTVYVESPEGVWLTLHGDSSHVVARDSSHVVAWDSSHVEARDSSHVVARDYVAVHLHSARAEVSGGVLIDLTRLDLDDPYTWCEYHGVSVVDSVATVYKAVDDKCEAGHEYTVTNYAPGSTPEAHDWVANHSCGGGLHFGPSPIHASEYNGCATRWMAVGVRLEEMSVINDGGPAKVKARRVVTPCVEVDRLGRPVERVEPASVDGAK